MPVNIGLAAPCYEGSGASKSPRLVFIAAEYARAAHVHLPGVGHDDLNTAEYRIGLDHRLFFGHRGAAQIEIGPAEHGGHRRAAEIFLFDSAPRFAEYGDRRVRLARKRNVAGAGGN